jgi:hypothetical protein
MDAREAERSQIKLIDEGVDHPNRIVRADIIFEAWR